MIQKQRPQGNETIGDLLPELREREIPLVPEEAGVKEIVEAFSSACHSRLLYVVDDNGRLQGVISLGHMVRHVFFHYHDSCPHIQNISSMAIAETARDFMQREPLAATLSDEVEEVLGRMIKHNVKEVPVVDEGQRVVGDLTMVDLLQHHEYI
ncbi:MAG: CBS domain-containing protein [Desulfobulbaceae bacterium]|nr:CBS domain-containing protein [Desulfobulbaceae bacterium]